MTTLGSILGYLVHDRATFTRKPRRKPRRGTHKDWRYRAWIRMKPCACGCGRHSDAAHTGQHAYGQKAPDWTCIPLYRVCHQEFDSNPSRFAALHGFNPYTLVAEYNAEWRDLADKDRPMRRRDVATAILSFVVFVALVYLVGGDA